MNADGTRTLISTDEHGVEVGGVDVMHIAGEDRFGLGSTSDADVENENDAKIVGGDDF